MTAVVFEPFGGVVVAAVVGVGLGLDVLVDDGRLVGACLAAGEATAPTANIVIVKPTTD